MRDESENSELETRSNPQSRRAFGRTGEDLAAEFLEAKGYQILHRNWRKRAGELDLIAQDETVIVFVEVKARRSNAYGEAVESVDERKRRQLTQLAMLYLSENDLQQTDCRFDVVAIDYRGQVPHLAHYPNAFLPSEL